MKIILRQSLLMTLLFLAPQLGESAVSIRNITSQAQNTQEVEAGKQDLKQHWTSIKKSLGGKKKRLKERIYKWIQFGTIAMPTGKLLTSIILMLMSIVLLAVGGATKYGLILGILGSVAIIGAVIFFLLWMSDRSKTAPTIN